MARIERWQCLDVQEGWGGRTWLGTAGAPQIAIVAHVSLRFEIYKGMRGSRRQFCIALVASRCIYESSLRDWVFDNLFASPRILCRVTYFVYLDETTARAKYSALDYTEVARLISTNHTDCNM